MIKDLIPAIISEPVLPQAIRIHGHDPRRAKCASSHRDIHHSLLILRRDCQFHDLLDLFRRKDTFKSLKDPLRGRNIDPFAPVGHAKCWKGLLKFLRRIMVFDPSRNPHRLFGSSASAQAQSAGHAAGELTNRDEMGKTLGGTTFRPSISPVMFESWFPNASFAFRGGVKGLPTLSRAAPRKNGSISTETPYASRSGRKRTALVNPNHE